MIAGIFASPRARTMLRPPSSTTGGEELLMAPGRLSAQGYTSPTGPEPSGAGARAHAGTNRFCNVPPMSAVLSPTEPATARRRPAGTGTIVEVLKDAAALRALVPDWEALAAEAAEPNPFYEHWMLLPALEAYGKEAGAGEDFRCVAVWDSGKLGALFPLRLEHRYRGLPLHALRSWTHRNMLLATPLVRAKSLATCVAALLRSNLAPLIELDW